MLRLSQQTQSNPYNLDGLHMSTRVPELEITLPVREFLGIYYNIPVLIHCIRTGKRRI